MADNPDGPDKYDPDAERCCKDCGNTFKTKEGVLHNRYEFHCSPCHMWGKNVGKKVYIGIGAGAVVLIILVIYYVHRYLTNKCTRSHIFDDDGNEI